MNHPNRRTLPSHVSRAHPGRRLRARHPSRAPARPTPALFSPTEHAERRFWEFFTAHIRNPNTRLAYPAVVRRFAEWCERRDLALDQIEPMVLGTGAAPEYFSIGRSPWRAGSDALATFGSPSVSILLVWK